MTTNTEDAPGQFSADQGPEFFEMVVRYHANWSPMVETLESYSGMEYISLPHNEFQILIEMIDIFQQDVMRPRIIEQMFEIVKSSMTQDQVTEYNLLKTSIDRWTVRLLEAMDKIQNARVTQ